MNTRFENRRACILGEILTVHALIDYNRYRDIFGEMTDFSVKSAAHNVSVNLNITFVDFNSIISNMTDLI